MSRLQQTAGIVLGALLLLTALFRVIPPSYRTPAQDTPPSIACVGEPIVVDFPYQGTVIEPWTCRVQCEDNRPRYILYSNGKATQCAPPPACTDLGEDTGVTCEPPARPVPADDAPLTPAA